MAMHKRGLIRHAVSALSVRPPVMFVYSVKTSKHILELFLLSGSHAIIDCPYQTLYDNLLPTPNGGVECSCMTKSRFSTDISLYLGNDTRYGHSYRERQ